MSLKKSITLGLSILYTLMFFAQNKPYKAGEVFTENIYQYGKMEVRMLAATGSGIISNFFTFKEGSELPSAFWEEIDIEVFGKDGANSWQTNLITGEGNSNLTRTEGVHQNSGLGNVYHTYTIEWKPNSVTWLIDGVITRQINGGQSLLISDETTLRFNIWNPNIPEWVGPFNEAILPVHMYVNWIKFYEWNGNSFENTPSLEDNFNSFNTNTWTKANHTFNENLSDFVPENVNVVDGYLVLSITNDDATGYNEVPPVDQGDVTLSVTSFEDLKKNSSLDIFPNPSRSSFNLSAAENISKIEIFDISGKLVESVYNQNLSAINCGEDLLAGVYFMKAHDKTGNILKSTKLIKK